MQDIVDAMSGLGVQSPLIDKANVMAWKSCYFNLRSVLELPPTVFQLTKDNFIATGDPIESILLSDNKSKGDYT